MTWIAPVAFFGALVVALPILIHMMGRGRTTVVRFPSLRFLEVSRLLPARRTRIHDLPLLLLRAGSLIAAVIALAQPLFRAETPAAAPNTGIARIVVLDTSASMLRMSVAGKRIADSLAADAARGARLVRAADLRGALRGAAAWAAMQSGRVEIVIVSDFQQGALDAAAVAAVDPTIGLAFARTPVAPTNGPVLTRSRQGGADVVSRTRFVGDRTDVDWTVTRGRPEPSRVDVQGATGTANLVSVTRAAALVVGVPVPFDTMPVPITVNFAGASTQSGRQGEGALVSRRQAGIVARLLHDPLVASEAFTDSNEPVASVISRMGSAVERGQPVLTVVSGEKPGSIGAVALVAAVERASSTAAPASESDPSVIPDAALKVWERAPAERPAALSKNPSDPSAFDGRWFWVLALALLGAEALLRRAPAYSRPESAIDAG